MLTAKEIRQKNIAELQAYLSEVESKLQDLSLKAAQRQLKNVSEIRPIKREIARIMTILRERQ